MTEEILGASFIASFLAGMIALFAPCCISFLLPAYFGSIFKERQRVLLMTVIYSFGIFCVFLPIILGAYFIFSWYMEYHDTVFIVGSVFMIIIGIAILRGFHLPMPKRLTNIQNRLKLQKVGSVYLLGLLSGLSTTCCAPVLLGVVSLTAFTQEAWQAISIGVFYVLGMVTPLYLASFYVDKTNVLSKSFFRRPITKNVTVSQLLSFIIFTGMGSVIFILTLLGKIEMEKWAKGFSAWSADLMVKMQNIFADYILLDRLAAFVIIVVLFLIIRAAWRRRGNHFEI